MWCAHKNVETGVVHAVALPGGMSPHGFALNWPLVRTEEPLTCHLCLQFAYAQGERDQALAGMLPENAGGTHRPERRCLICRAPVSRCCC